MTKPLSHRRKVRREFQRGQPLGRVQIIELMGNVNDVRGKGRIAKDCVVVDRLNNELLKRETREKSLTADETGGNAEG